MYFPSMRSRSTRQRSRTSPATSITRIQAGMPQAHSAPAQARAQRTRRSASPPVTYTRGSYLAPSRGQARIVQPLFRIG